MILFFHFYKTFIQREVVANRVLPSIRLALIIRVMRHDPSVNGAESESLSWTVENGLCDEGRVTKRWLGSVCIPCTYLADGESSVCGLGLHWMERVAVG